MECRLSGVENERKFDSIKYEQIENECMLLKSEIIKNEQIQPVIEKLQVQNSKQNLHKTLELISFRI